jgi:hypothetical protein
MVTIFWAQGKIVPPETCCLAVVGIFRDEPYTVELEAAVLWD